jgi:hypothetical protein
MFLNLIVASTNLYGLRAWAIAPNTSIKWSLGFLITASFIYHLIEIHKHDMAGMPFWRNKVAHHTLLNLDRFGVVLMAYNTLSYDLVMNNMDIFGLFAFGAMCLVFSEPVCEYFKWQKLYVVSHSMWHLIGYHCLYVVFNRW